jgi:four helix bundle protein
MRDYKKYTIWQEGHQLTLSTYKLTHKFPKEELYGITSQIRRAVSSIPTNIAEGCGRETDLDFRRFLIIALGSATEVEYLLLLCFDLSYINESEYTEANTKIIVLRKQLRNLIDKLK